MMTATSTARGKGAAAYLDHNATSPVLPAVIDAMVDAMREGGNASSVHAFGRAAHRRLEDARAAVASRAGCKPAEVIFTSGGTEANNLALLGL
ncbi:MAG TPA: aminotransferase class V-fold PLP-dependent enzyme, partial [Sphingomonadales bacterium]